MTVVVDTSILVDHLRGDTRAVRVLQGAFATERVIASGLTKVEVLAGVRAGEEAATGALLSVIEWIPVDEAIADRAGDFARQYIRSHPGVDSIRLCHRRHCRAAWRPALDAEPQAPSDVISFLYDPNLPR